MSENEEEFAVSSITHYEIYIGAHIEQVDFWTRFFRLVGVIPFDKKCAVEAVKIYKDLKDKNKLIELPDLFIAATALANNLSIATHNVRHFERIDNLTIVKSNRKI